MVAVRKVKGHMAAHQQVAGRVCRFARAIHSNEGTEDHFRRTIADDYLCFLFIAHSYNLNTHGRSMEKELSMHSSPYE